MAEAGSHPEIVRREIGLEDQFTFECKEKCMGNCCRLITILLDPWDIEVMARHLRLPESDFLATFCEYDFGTSSHWPFVWLKHAAKGFCAFMLPDGKCSIYLARPRNCRTYPIGRAIKIEVADEVPQLTERFFLMIEKERLCLGHESGRTWTVKEWLLDAEAFKYYELSDLYLSLVHYASETLNAREWLTPKTARILLPLLFTPDVLRKKLALKEEDIDPETFYRRRLKATRIFLTEMAASFGFGPLAGKTTAVSNMSLAEYLRQLILER